MHATLVELSERQGVRRDFADAQPLTATIAELGELPGPAATVQVLGTNGKGSTASMLAHLGRALGHRVGLYTSPHLHTVRERINVDGRSITDECLASALGRVYAAESTCGARLSFFEVLTVAARIHFAEVRVDWMILEAGLGGRFDATSHWPSELQLFTRIGLDHQAILGSTIEQIAAEKAGAIRADNPVASVGQLDAATELLERRAGEFGTRPTIVEPWSVGPPHLPGDHQRANAALAHWAAQQLHGAALPRSWSLEAWRSAQWPGRGERLDWGRAHVTFDVGHNLDAIAALRQRHIAAPFDLLVFGCLADKSPEALLEQLRPCAHQLWFVPPPHPRASELGEVGKAADRRFAAIDDPGFRDAWASTATRELEVAVVGSHALVASIRAQVLGLATSQHDPPELFDALPRPT